MILDLFRPANDIDKATTYDEWSKAAQKMDDASGASDWKKEDRSTRFDHKSIRIRLERLRKVRESGDPHEVLFTLNEGIHGNMGGMGHHNLYTVAKFGTKNLIVEYIDEIIDALHFIAKVPDSEISFHEKLDFFNRASHCYGRSALMLSGGGAIGPFHLGVTKALMEQSLLPSVISGSSAGSFVAAVIGTHTDEELKEFFDPANLVRTSDRFVESNMAPLRGNQRIGLEHLKEQIADWVPDMTFQEAFEKTGRHINISVAPAEIMQTSRLLNATTSPNVFIREAVQASCAIPGIFPPVVLAAKNAAGERQKYLPQRRWVDGSVTDDLPAKRLSRLYGVNHFIVSLINPIVLWSVTDPMEGKGVAAQTWDIYQRGVKEWLRATQPITMRLTRNLYPLNLLLKMSYSVATQNYSYDVNIMPRRKFWDPRKLLSVLSEEETRYLITEGEAATWPKIEMIRNSSKISAVLDKILVDYEHRIDDKMALNGNKTAA